MLTQRGRTWAAADSLLSDGGPVMQMGAPKVWTPAPRIVVGACGDLSWVERLRSVEWPSKESDLPRLALDLAGDAEGAALLGWYGRLWYLSSGRECAPIRDKAYAVGSGAPYALGALAVSQAGPARRVADAVRVAARYSPGDVGGRVVSVGPC